MLAYCKKRKRKLFSYGLMVTLWSLCRSAPQLRLQRARAEVGHGRGLRSLAALCVESEASRRGACLGEQEFGRAPLVILPRGRCVVRRRRGRRMQLRGSELAQRACLAEGEGGPHATQRALLGASLV